MDGKLVERLKALEDALRPFAVFAQKWNEKPISGLAQDPLYAIHAGTEWEAGLNLSDCQRALKLLAGSRLPGGE